MAEVSSVVRVVDSVLESIVSGALYQLWGMLITRLNEIVIFDSFKYV